MFAPSVCKIYEDAGAQQIAAVVDGNGPARMMKSAVNKPASGPRNLGLMNWMFEVGDKRDTEQGAIF